jgi:RHS repeat-associated protein
MDGTNAYLYGNGGTPFEQVNLASGALTYLVSDEDGSVRGTVGSSGALTATVSYDAWGNPQAPGGLSTTPFSFAGGYTDPDGLIYLVNRYYDPQLGQFVSVDPDLSDTLQPYGYANGDPVVNTDPDGLGGPPKPAPITGSNPAGCNMYVDGAHPRKSGKYQVIGFKTTTVCAHAVDEIFQTEQLEKYASFMGIPYMKSVGPQFTDQAHHASILQQKNMVVACTNSKRTRWTGYTNGVVFVNGENYYNTKFAPPLWWNCGT